MTDDNDTEIEPAPKPPRRRTGGRSARIERQVREAVRQLMIEGVSGISSATIAERSGVHVSTIYRRWGDTAGLQLEVGLELASSQIPIVDSGALRTDMVAYARQSAWFTLSPVGSFLIRQLLLLGDEERRWMWERRFAATLPIWERAAARGEIAGLDDAHDAWMNMNGALYFRILFSGEPVDLEDAAQASVKVGLATLGLPVLAPDHP